MKLERDAALCAADRTMLVDSQNSQVCDTVIASIAVDMVDLLSQAQAAAKMLFHYPAMLIHSLSVHGDAFVFREVICLLPCTIAGMGAKKLRIAFRFGNFERLFTKFAFDGNLRVVVRNLACDCFQTLGFSFRKSDVPQAFARAATRSTELVRSYSEPAPAMFTIDMHGEALRCH